MLTAVLDTQLRICMSVTMMDPKESYFCAELYDVGAYQISCLETPTSLAHHCPGLSCR